MSIIPVDEPPGAANGTTKPGGFWQRLAQAVDEHFVDRTKRAVPEASLRRSKQDIDRFRRLLHKGSMAPVAAGVYRTSRRGITQTRPR